MDGGPHESGRFLRQKESPGPQKVRNLDGGPHPVRPNSIAGRPLFSPGLLGARIVLLDAI
jgi:hypothetical protein